jgi:uncharacterized protein (TIGR03000 family)
MPYNAYLPPVSSSPSTYYGSLNSPSTAQNQANIRVTVPTSDAEVWFNGAETRERGTVRDFVSPTLTSGKTYSYEIRARWREGDREMDQTREVEVHAGDSINVAFPVATQGSSSTGG